MKPLPNHETRNPTAIEERFCKPFEKLKRQPMTEFQAEMLMKLWLADSTYELPEKEKPFLLKVIERRQQYSFSYHISDTRLLFFLVILSENPGHAVMYLTYLQYWCKKHGVAELTLNIFCDRIFPMGFPNKAELTKLWDSCKVKTKPGHMASDNLLDYQTAMESIHLN